MARSTSDDLRLNDNTWNYHANTGENCAPGSLNEVKKTHQTPNSNIMAENIYQPSNLGNEAYMAEQYTLPVNDNKTNENQTYNTSPNSSRVNPQSYGNAMLNLGNGQLMRVYYDENNQQLIFPMSGQYELFNHNQGLCDIPLQKSQPSHVFTLNQECQINNSNVHPSTATIQCSSYPQESFHQMPNTPTSNFIKDVLGNWEPNSTGTYSPFGQNYPLNHPDVSTILSNNTILEPKITQASPKRTDTAPLPEPSNKKRIVAEVKPMRPSYSDVLAKNTKNNVQENSKKVKPQNNIETKILNKMNTKSDKPINITKASEDTKHKSDKKQNNIFSGSESGDTNTDEAEKPHKTNKKSKNKHNNMSRRWSSLDDITTEEGSFIQDGESQFLLINDSTEKSIKKEKKDKVKSTGKVALEEGKNERSENKSQFVFQEGQNENNKAKKRKEGRTYYKIPKTPQDKKKTQSKQRKNKPWYASLCQSYLEHWGEATRKALVWFFYLLSDVCHMSFHLSFDLCTSVFTQTYVSSQAVWRSTKDWLSKIGKNKYLTYIDKKFGHTYFAFWRKLTWFKKATDSDKGNDPAKLNTNIPLPATGEEAMKRLLACKGKDPYSILGVNVQCCDEDIKRYYRRQAFLVHPDKNQQPGAEEAFKILQHAFDLIGEPERREAYDRRALESRHMESTLSELNTLLTQLHDKMEFAANTIRCTNCGRRHKRVPTDRPCYAARYCAQCKIRHSAREGDIWAESSMFGLLVMYYACMDGAVYQITQWASCQKRNLKQLRPNCHVVQYRIVLGHRAAAADAAAAQPAPRPPGHDPNLEEFLNNLYSQSGASPAGGQRASPNEPADAKKRRAKKPRV